MTRRRYAVVDVQLTVVSAESSLADTPVAAQLVQTRAAVLTWRPHTLVYLQLTCLTCARNNRLLI